MEWVIDILKVIFKHSESMAKEITLTIHNEGSGIAGIYSYEIAEQKAVEAVTASRDQGFPLQLRVDAE
jgi:ATP-dependent Clp protease adaptor protein ClpS